MAITDHHRKRLWQCMPSMAFKLGLYEGAVRVRDVRQHGDFGVGQFAALDGELTAIDGRFVRARADGSVEDAKDEDELCFAQLCFFEPSDIWEMTEAGDEAAFEQAFQARVASPNIFWAFHAQGRFASVVATAPPPLAKPFPAFADAVKLRKSFPGTDIEGSMLGFYSPLFTGETGIPGFHYHWLSNDGALSGHVTSFTVTSASVRAMALEENALQLPSTPEYRAAALPGDGE